MYIFAKQIHIGGWVTLAEPAQISCLSVHLDMRILQHSVLTDKENNDL